MKNQVIAELGGYNKRRYSIPWVGSVDEKGKIQFSQRIGTWTGDHSTGGAGNLVVFDPQEGTVYAYGQKDYRGKNSMIEYTLYREGEFVPCDKLGRITE